MTSSPDLNIRSEKLFVDNNHIFYGFNRAQLIAVSLLAGCDFSDGINRVGFAKAVELVREHWNEETSFDIEYLVKEAMQLGKRLQYHLISLDDFEKVTLLSVIRESLSVFLLLRHWTFVLSSFGHQHPPSAMKLCLQWNPISNSPPVPRA